MTTLTVGPLLTSAGQVVTEFGGLIVLVVGLSLGLGLVSYIISRAKSAKRG
jgi:hypothetical protein